MRIFLYSVITLALVLVEAKNEHETKNNKKQVLGEKPRKLGHWGEQHWTPEEGQRDPAHIKDIIKHAPLSVSHHEAHLQGDVSHKTKAVKHRNLKKQKQKEKDDLYLQDLMMSESAGTEHGRQRQQHHQSEPHSEHKNQQQQQHLLNTAPKTMRNQQHRTRTQHQSETEPRQSESRRADKQERKERKKNKKNTKMNKKDHKKQHKNKKVTPIPVI